MDIGFENSEYAVSEDRGAADFCVILSGRIERDLFLNVATMPAVSSGTEGNECCMTTNSE